MTKKQKKSTLMVVDDEPDIVLLLGDFLAKEGFRVYTSHSGEQAIEKIRKEQVDMVLLDLAMSGMDGLETLSQIKKIKPEIHVIMITSYRDAEKVVEAFRLGAFDCIFKPFDFKYLRKSLFSKLFE